MKKNDVILKENGKIKIKNRESFILDEVLEVVKQRKKMRKKNK